MELLVILLIIAGFAVIVTSLRHFGFQRRFMFKSSNIMRKRNRHAAASIVGVVLLIITWLLAIYVF